MEKFKGILLTIVLMLIAMGIIGGIGYAIYGGSWPIAIGVVVFAVLAWPGIKRVWNMWTEQ